MPWFKVDDSIHSHPKAMSASLASLGLWSMAGAWSGAHLTGGFVPDSAIPSLSRGASKLADELVDAGLWKRVKGGYQFHDWCDYQPDADEEREKREKRREAGRKGGVASGKTRSKPRSKTEANASGVASPIVQPPSPSPCSSNEEQPPCSPPSGDAKNRGTRLPAEFTVTPELRAYAAKKAPGVDVDAETEHFVDYWSAKAGQGARKVDWQATWRTWMRRAQERQGQRNGQRAGPRPTKDDKVRVLQSMKTPAQQAIEGGWM